MSVENVSTEMLIREMETLAVGIVDPVYKIALTEFIRRFKIAKKAIEDHGVIPVRCKGCLYRSQYADENGLYKCGGLLTPEGETYRMVEPVFFCGFGKKRGSKEDENTTDIV